MNHTEKIYYRLASQMLLGEKFLNPVEVVEWLGAIQAQDYEGAKWTIGMRTQAATASQIQQAMTDGKILRIHLLRPTWHLASARDIRWLLSLTGPRIIALNAGRHRQLELDDNIFKRSQAVLEKALSGGKHLTRKEIQLQLEAVGIEARSARLAHIMMVAELQGVVCSGERRGKHVTYALLEERVPATSTLTRDEALFTLITRYFTSHGPATAHDFARWSNLTLGDTNMGIASVGALLEKVTIDGSTYYYSRSQAVEHVETHNAHLLSPYDDFTLGYKDHPLNVDPVTRKRIKNAVYPWVIMINGKIVGVWQASINTSDVVVTITPVSAFSAADLDAIEVTAQRYGDYLQKVVLLKQRLG